MTATPDRHDGESFRVSHYGFHVGYARSVPELERWVELTGLEEALRRLGVHRSRAGSPRGLHAVRTLPPRPAARLVMMAGAVQHIGPPGREP